MSKIDLHTAEAARMFGVTPDKVTIEMRHRAKTWNYVRAYSNPPRFWSKSDEQD